MGAINIRSDVGAGPDDVMASFTRVEQEEVRLTGDLCMCLSWLQGHPVVARVESVTA